MRLKISLLNVIVAFIGFFPMNATVQENYIFTHLKSDVGLPHQQVESMAFDHDGMLWIGTRNGLSKYDGYSFVTYYNNPVDSTSIPHDFICEIFVDSDNNVWIGSDYGICRYRRETDNFERFEYPSSSIRHIVETKDGSIVCGGAELYEYNKDKNAFRHLSRKNESYIVGLTVSPDNYIYISTYGSISRFDKDSGQEIVLDTALYSDFLLGSDAIVPLFFDHNGLLWIGRDGKGVMSFDVTSGQKRIYTPNELTDGTSRVITEDAKGNIWVGTEKGVTVIDPTVGVVAKLTQQFGNSGTLSDNAIYCIVPDKYDNMWIGTYWGGINILRRQGVKFDWIQPGYTHTTLRGKVVRRIVEPEPGIIWLATEDGGINILNLRTGIVEKFDEIPMVGNNVHELYFDEKTNEMWIGTFRSGLFRYNMASRIYRHYNVLNSGLKSNSVFGVTRQNNGSDKIWIGTIIGLMYYNPTIDEILPVNNNILDYDFTYCLHADSGGNLWVGTVNNGLFRIDGYSGEIKNWNSNSALSDNYVTCLYEDGKGHIFVGTNNNGINILDSNKLEFLPFPEISKSWGTICGISKASSGDVLWITTSNGLYKVNPEDYSYIRFSSSDGLPENQFNFSSILQASDSLMYCGTVNGLVKFSPGLSKHSGNTLPVHLWRLVLNNDTIVPLADSPLLKTSLDDTSSLELDYISSRLFSIDYGIISPAGIKDVEYQIFVDGLDKEWRNVGTQCRFTALEIPPGKYIFKVRASVSGADWNEVPVKELNLVIAPPFYRSTIAWVIYAILALLIFYGAYRVVGWWLKEREKDKLERMERDKNDELNREKLEFFTNISHELKTPLSLILAPLRYLSANEELSDESRKRLSTAIANTSKMVDLINELVTFNRVESGNFQLYLQKGNPLPLIETMVEYFRGPASEKNISINVITQDNGEEVWFSMTYLERILSNLLSNAVKYTEKDGNIDVRASIIESESNDLYLKLEVNDTGIGIMPDEIDNIFKKYYQANVGHAGWGIGLATVKRLVEIHKGTISVSSKVGVGSSFLVTLNVTDTAFDKLDSVVRNNTQPLSSLPTLISNTLEGHSLVENKENKDKNKVSILIVEDNSQLMDYLSNEFSGSYNVFTAKNGLEALNITSEYPIDIVVSDVMMPKMDGIELCNRLKNDLATSHIPVVLLTAKNDDESVWKGFESGAEAYIPKPFDPNLLKLRVENILRARRASVNVKVENSEVVEAKMIEELPPLNKFDSGFVSAINRIINENIDNSDFSIAYITKELGISRSLLHIKMKTFFNSSMSDYIKECRMTKACELLRNGYNVSETSYKVGYSEPNYFSKVFKKTFGMSPSEYISSLSSQQKE